MFKRFLIFLFALVSFSLAAQTNLSYSADLSAQDNSLTTFCRGYNSVDFQVKGTWSATLKFEGTVNGSDWITIYAVKKTGGAVDTVATTNGIYDINSNGFTSVRARVSAYTSGTATVQAFSTEGVGVVSLSNQTTGGAAANVAVTSIAAGSNTIGNVGLATGTNHVGYIKIDSMPASSLGASTNHLGGVKLDSVGSAAVAQGHGTAANAIRVELPTDGTGLVSAAQSGTWSVRNQDGVGNALASSTTTPAGTEQALITRNIPSGTQAVSGTVTANAGTNLNTSALALDATLGRSQGSTTSGQTGPLIQGAVTTAAPSYTTAQTSPLSLTTAGALRTDASATTQPVSGTVTANAGSGTFATNVSQINGITPLMGNGVTGTGSLRVTVASDNTAFSVNATATGAAAHGASISGNPVRAGLRAISSDIAAVTGGQTTDWVATVDGKAVTMPYAIQGSRWKYSAAAGGLVSTAGVTAKTAAGAGIRNCITSIQVVNEHASTSTEVVINDGASGTAMWRGWAQAGGGGLTAQFPVPICGTANTLTEIAEVTATTTTGVLVSLQGYTSAE
jgi:hypothetical protein